MDMHLGPLRSPLVKIGSWTCGRYKALQVNSRNMLVFAPLASHNDFFIFRGSKDSLVETNRMSLAPSKLAGNLSR